MTIKGYYEDEVWFTTWDGAGHMLSIHVVTFEPVITEEEKMVGKMYSILEDWALQVQTNITNKGLDELAQLLYDKGCKIH